AGDMRGTRYSPLGQIDASNFNKLEVAWRFKTDQLGPRPEYKLEGTPLMVKGVLYTTGGTRRSVIALDGKTGELIWAHSLREGTRAAVSPRQLSGRGVAYWADGRGDERILYVTTGYRLVELNAKTGAMIGSFGKDGVVDLKVGAVVGADQQINLENGEIGLHATPAIAKDVVVVGSSFAEGFTPPTHNNTKGLVRAFDVRTGKQLWQFNTIPRPGEAGNDTWEKDSWAINGNTGVWSQITIDEELNSVYLPVEEPTSDIYGGHRPGDNLYADTLVCVDLLTGKIKWHFQFVHHPIWDFDISSAPILADITVDGRAIKAVAVPTKQSFLYVFDRVSGKPVWPMPERPVPQSNVPGEKLSPTQPFPTKPPAYGRQYLKVPDDIIDFTPELRAEALEKLKRYHYPQTPFCPPELGDVHGLLGVVGAGNGTNWPGGAYDPETHVVYVPVGNVLVDRALVAPPPGFSDVRYLRGLAGRPFEIAPGPGFGSAADAPKESEVDQKLKAALKNLPPMPAVGPIAGRDVQGMPTVKPPYGMVAAISLDRGEIMWQVPHGDTPDNIRNHPALKGLNIPKTGQSGTDGVGLLITKTLVVIGDPQATTTPEHPRGAMLRAYNKATGEQVGALWMPARQSGSPMTYSIDGKQYIIVAVSGGNYSGEYIAFSLPTEGRRTTEP
ncbi:MAG TPA: PQQ-binding-like beta-propeller repeat protein, partial [Vicinamibacterales bacterium]|nr:PQQ-binding-like beta-propeller repeat protein [Vicinamibacterales bacterium]